MYIVKLWIIEKKNGEEIYEKLKEEFESENISKNLIYEILNTLRRYIVHYTKDVYQIENISSENKMETFAIDESLFVHLAFKYNIYFVSGL